MELARTGDDTGSIPASANFGSVHHWRVLNIITFIVVVNTIIFAIRAVHVTFFLLHVMACRWLG